mmetsp:Transcript_24038/g.67339  ORF Transcript_24038/g.67339 Transcript_24038/m.67339 type:complete len:160 (+) Transcript_24038:278-757(+)
MWRWTVLLVLVAAHLAYAFDDDIVLVLVYNDENCTTLLQEFKEGLCYQDCKYGVFCCETNSCAIGSVCLPGLCPSEYLLAYFDYVCHSVDSQMYLRAAGCVAEENGIGHSGVIGYSYRAFTRAAFDGSCQESCNDSCVSDCSAKCASDCSSKCDSVCTL